MGLLISMTASASDAEADSLCGPFPEASTQAARAEAQSILLASAKAAAGDAGARPETGITTPESASGGPGTILRLPAAVASPPSSGEGEGPSEAILALPKDGGGKIPTDFELGPGSRIESSFFSPVLCATVARVAGPAGSPIEQLVTVVPEGSALIENNVYSSAAAEITPMGEADVELSDPYLPLQYGLKMTGVRDARGLTAGAGVRIALLDSTPEAAHGDLSSGSVAPVEEASAALKEVGVHGTLMAGVISATEGNGFGIVGVAPGAELISIPICEPAGKAGGRCTIYRLLQGLDRAWRSEAEIVNLSLSGPPNVLLERGVARLEELGTVVVAAAGNEGTDQKRYPAAYPSVIGVGAVDRMGKRFEQSNFGAWVELSAPGVDVLSTIPGNAFAFGNGTSLAAAHVSGMIAVLTGVTNDPKLARAELFRAALSDTSGSRTPSVPPVCEVLLRLGVDCGSPAVD